MVNKLGLPTMLHPKPYKLQWLNDSGECFDEVSQAINNITMKIRGRILLKRGGMMRVNKHHQRINCMFQLGQLQGAKRIKEAFNDGLILSC
ncbi:hypothetical protein Q3G72_026097 [Acer saccharum]|nr:hypothetical protein Q3G72_026097 [Acer saccharum]